MNEKFHKLFISTMAICCSILLLFPVSVRDVYADGDLNDIADILQPFPLSGILDVSQYCTLGVGSHARLRLSTSSAVNTVQEGKTGIYLLKYSFPNDDSNTNRFLMFSTPNDDIGTLNIYLDYSMDGITWYYANQYLFNNNNPANYVGSGIDGTAYNVYYKDGGLRYVTGLPSQYPIINLLSGQNSDTIKQVISYRLESRPWGMWTSSSGGIHFQNGSSLNAEQRAKYEQIYIVMDISQDNSVTEEEVNTYNSTYNTNYDYSQINGGDTFTELQFLEYIATEIMNGNEDPGGGTGSGGDGTNGAGITIGDGSFTQSQTQTIEENAINVTVNNDNSLNQENTQWLNSIINNNVGGEEQQNAFENAIGSISGFTGVARSFATLASVVLGFLPAWVTTLLGVMFAILFVFIVFRLIHLFI